MDGHANLPSDQERSMLRDAIRTLLEQHWPSDKAKAFAAEPAWSERDSATAGWPATALQ